MTKTVFLAASMSFYQELVEIEKQLKDKGFTVKIPASAQIMKRRMMLFCRLKILSLKENFVVFSE